MKRIQQILTNIKIKGKFIGFSLTTTLITVVLIVVTSINGGKNALE